jgi:hypothetical protein
MTEPCAAVPCSHEYDVWTFSPRVRGLVPSCIAHAVDVTAGGVQLKSRTTVRERGVWQ